jgi:hypothetical protein
MRAAGAHGLQNGVWVLPSRPEQQQFVEDLIAYVEAQGATSYAFEVTTLTPPVEERLLAAFRAERDEEYAEFCERCEALLAEIARESADGKFTFAELEEAEADLHKLETWLAKITARDFVEGSQKPAALDALERSRVACENFAAEVYSRQDIASRGDQ